MGDLEQQAQMRRSVAAMADRVAKAAAKEAVLETLQALGFDTSNPIKSQEQFAALREIAAPRTLKNLEWLEAVHTASERVTETSWKTLVKIAVTGLIGLLVLMTREYWTNHIPWK
jgi:hypothetical protein